MSLLSAYKRWSWLREIMEKEVYLLHRICDIRCLLDCIVNKYYFWIITHSFSRQTDWDQRWDKLLSLWSPSGFTLKTTSLVSRPESSLLSIALEWKVPLLEWPWASRERQPPPVGLVLVWNRKLAKHWVDNYLSAFSCSICPDTQFTLSTHCWLRWSCVEKTVNVWIGESTNPFLWDMLSHAVDVNNQRSSKFAFQLWGDATHNSKYVLDTLGHSTNCLSSAALHTVLLAKNPLREWRKLIQSISENATASDFIVVLSDEFLDSALMCHNNSWSLFSRAAMICNASNTSNANNGSKVQIVKGYDVYKTANGYFWIKHR